MAPVNRVASHTENEALCTRQNETRQACGSQHRIHDVRLASPGCSPHRTKEASREQSRTIKPLDLHPVIELREQIVVSPIQDCQRDCYVHLDKLVDEQHCLTFCTAAAQRRYQHKYADWPLT
jgi:hypothetical protein